MNRHSVKVDLHLSTPSADPTIGNRSESIERLFDGEVIAYASRTGLVCDQLYEEERDYVSRAVVRRKAEFGTARVLVRSALQERGFPAQPFLPREDRSPRWPDGVIGSISHTDNLCGVVISTSKQLLSIGFDIEADRSEKEGLKHLVLTPRESSELSTDGSNNVEWMIGLIFSIKEAIYKCQFPITGQFVNFIDVGVAIDQDSSSYRVERASTSCQLTNSILYSICGRYCDTGSYVMASAYLKHAGS